jgi:hypothetical protein
MKKVLLYQQLSVQTRLQKISHNFNSFGGSPVLDDAGLGVLDVI